MSDCIEFYKRCKLDPYPEHVYLSDPNDWFTKMLTTGDHPNCPEFLKGIWWLQDNSGGEVLMTFHDAEWVTEKYGRKLFCGWGYCNLKPEDLENAYKPLCDRQMI